MFSAYSSTSVAVTGATGEPRRLVVDLFASQVQWSLTTGGVERIRGEAPAGWQVDVIGAPTVSDGDGNRTPSAESLVSIRDAEVYFGYGLPRPLFLAARRLRWVHSAAAGVGSLLYPEMLRSNVLITNSAGVHAIPIAEYVVGGVLYLLRQLDVAVDLQRRGVWSREPFVGAESRMRELADCRALILGAGGIGREVATRLSALGALCVGVRRRPELGAPQGFQRVVGPDAIESLLGDSDLLVIAAPATPSTRALVTGRLLDRLPREAIVVNVSRGSLLDDDALAERIERGVLRGAVLDVFAEEPLPAKSRLWRLPSVLLTPHVSGVSPAGFWRRELDLFLDNWRRYVAGERLRNLVDKRAGY